MYNILPFPSHLVVDPILDEMWLTGRAHFAERKIEELDGEDVDTADKLFDDQPTKKWVFCQAV